MGQLKPFTIHHPPGSSIVIIQNITLFKRFLADKAGTGWHMKLGLEYKTGHEKASVYD